mmetsp:Transcript_20858/g.62230  ORF Transcript_20858/g.62230 Transcript_20858/m.62230 type:complete len:185 (-) Transcript_20858:11-565(-)
MMIQLMAMLAGARAYRGGAIRRGVVRMRDSSAVTWFKEGDRVRVTESVLSRGEDLLGRVGTVTQAWEKCEVDPTCCCAELADENAALHVELEAEGGSPARLYYFAEHELSKVTATVTASLATAAQAAQDVEPLLAAAPRRDLAVALVAPLVAYKIAATANKQTLMPSLDATILLAVAAAVYYCV